MKAFSAAGALFSAYSSTRSAIQAVTHPIAWVRDKLKEMVIDTMVNLALGAFKEEQKKTILDKVANHQKRVSFSVPVPSILQGVLGDDPAALKLLHEMANDALAAPLAALGYRVGQLQLSWDAENKAVLSVLELGITTS